jgi:hypothetical protein
MDECYYCGMQYHPMPVYTKMKNVVSDLPARINVCHLNIDPDSGDIVENHDCREEAKKDGYEFRKDLTPSR